MAFKQKGFPMHATKSVLKAHASEELDRLKKDVETFQKQHDEDGTEDSQKDLDWANQALEEYMSGADGGDHEKTPLEKDEGEDFTFDASILPDKQIVHAAESTASSFDPDIAVPDEVLKEIAKEKRKKIEKEEKEAGIFTMPGGIKIDTKHYDKITDPKAEQLEAMMQANPLSRLFTGIKPKK